MRRSAARGIALVLVLWVLTLLTVMAVGMTAAQRTETALTENHIADARFRALTDAAIVYTMFSFLAPPPETTGAGLGAAAVAGEEAAAWVPNGAPRSWSFDGNALSIAVYNEQSRINLNLAPAPILSALLRRPRGGGDGGGRHCRRDCRLARRGRSQIPERGGRRGL